jgi:two-component system, OmpR family, KDP operon response regulator KdpE
MTRRSKPRPSVDMRTSLQRLSSLVSASEAEAIASCRAHNLMQTGVIGLTGESKDDRTLGGAMKHEPKPAYGRRIGDLDGLPGRSVLVALSDPAVAGATAKHFASANIVPTLAFSCAQLLERVKGESYALVVLDAGLAHQEANVTERIAEAGDVPVILIGETDKGPDDPAVEVALEAADGGDLVRTGATLIDLARHVPLPEPVRWGDLELDVRTHQARWQGQPIRFTTLQFRIMEVLALAAGGLVTDEELSRRVWGDAALNDLERLVAHIRRIRKLIEVDPARPRFLMRIRGKGFRLVGEESSPKPTMR